MRRVVPAGKKDGVRRLRILAVLVAACAGLLFAVQAGAATYASSAEPETGTVTGNAAALQMPGTSGGQAVRFGGVPLPSTMAAVGDSITNGANIDGCCGDYRQYSWSTGGDAGISSHLKRLQAAQPGRPVTAANNARSGSRMADLERQLTGVAAGRPQYVTVMSGGNDACTLTVAAMTPAATYRTQFQAALRSFYTASPDSYMLVSSVPNVSALYSNYRGSAAAELIWASADICQSLLGFTNTEADRQAVVQRIREYNLALRETCQQYARCRYDNDAVFNYRLQADDISTTDYFHPSLKGQNALARVLWSAGYWPGL